MLRRVFPKLWLLLLIASSSALAAAKPPAVDLRQHPSDAESPIELSIVMYITNIVAIDESRETRDLPRVGYLTFLDAVFLASFAFFFLSAFEIIAVYPLHLDQRRPAALRLHSAGKWGYRLGLCPDPGRTGHYFLAR